MLQHRQAGMLDLAFAQGHAAGRAYGRALLTPAYPLRRPRNPYWCPIRWFVWRLSFSLAVYDAVHEF